MGRDRAGGPGAQALKSCGQGGVQRMRARSSSALPSPTALSLPVPQSPRLLPLLHGRLSHCLAVCHPTAGASQVLRTQAPSCAPVAAAALGVQGADAGGGPGCMRLPQSGSRACGPGRVGSVLVRAP